MTVGRSRLGALVAKALQKRGDVVRSEIAYLYNRPLAHLVFVLCVELFPDHEIYMTHGARAIEQYPEGCWERWYEKRMGRGG